MDTNTLLNGLLNSSWIFLLIFFVLFFTGLILLFFWLWFTNKLPIHWYNEKFHIRGLYGDYLAPRGVANGRFYLSPSTNERFIAIQKGLGFGPFGFSEVNGISCPVDTEIYPNDAVELVQHGYNNYEVITIKDQRKDKNGDPIDPIVLHESKQRTRAGFRAMERDRQLKEKDTPLWQFLLPYFVLTVTIVGCFLIVYAISTPLVTLVNTQSATFDSYQAASEANLKVAQYLDAWQKGNATVPFGNWTDAAPPGANASGG